MIRPLSPILRWTRTDPAGSGGGTLSDRLGARGLSTAGALLFGASFVRLLVLPVNFSSWAFALIIAVNGIASGMFASPDTASIMSAAPAAQRGVASGMRATFQNSGTALSNAVFFALMIARLATSLPGTLTSGLQQQGVSHGRRRGRYRRACPGAAGAPAGRGTRRLLTGEADFNALASTMLQGSVDGPVCRLRPRRPDHGVVAPDTGGKTLFGAELTGPAVARRYHGGSRVAVRRGSGPPPESALLFVVRASGQLVPVTDDTPPPSRDGDTFVLLEPAPPTGAPVPLPRQSAGQQAP
jgi:hypothetical protein